MFQNTAEAKMLVNPEFDIELGEKPHKDEEANTLKIAALISEGIRARYQPAQALRDAHPKAMAASRLPLRSTTICHRN
jgi:hypothetical protein